MKNQPLCLYPMLLDYLGSGASLLSTLFFIRQNSWAWPLAILATLLNCLLYGKTGIYADMVLEVFYCITSFYGWYRWQKKPSTNDQISYIPLHSIQILLLVLAVTILYLAIAAMLSNFTASNVVSLDALTTALSIMGQGLMCYKFIITWCVWLLADAIYAGLYLMKGLPAHSALMMLYIVLAIFGYWKWARLGERPCKSATSHPEPLHLR